MFLPKGTATLRERSRMRGDAGTGGEASAVGKRGANAEEACEVDWAGGEPLRAPRSSRLLCRDKAGEGDERCEGGGEVGDGARVATGVFGARGSKGPKASLPKPLPSGALMGSPLYAALFWRNSSAVRTASGTFCSLIDSCGGGAAGNGCGTAIPPCRGAADTRRDREFVGEPGWKPRGKERDDRREAEFGEMLMPDDDDGDGGETANGSALFQVGREGDDPALRGSGEIPTRPLKSRDRRRDGVASPSEAFRTLERPLARVLGARTRPARAVRPASCSGLSSRAVLGDARARERFVGRGVVLVSLETGLVSGRSIVPDGGENSISTRANGSKSWSSPRDRLEATPPRDLPPKGSCAGAAPWEA